MGYFSCYVLFYSIETEENRYYNMKKRIINPEFVYKWIPADIVSKWLTHGISYSPVSSFKDKTEFSCRYRKMSKRELFQYLEYLRCVRDYDMQPIRDAFSIKGGRKRIMSELYAHMKNDYPNWLHDKLAQRFYVCCLTYDDGSDFSWTDQCNKPRVQLKLNYSKLKEIYKKNIQPVRYCEHRPRVNQTDDIGKCAPEIIFTKYRYHNKTNYAKEAEIRIYLCRDAVGYGDFVNVNSPAEDNPYIYHTVLHDCLEEIIIGPDTPNELIEKWEKLLSSKIDSNDIISRFEKLLPISNNELVRFFKNVKNQSYFDGLMSKSHTAEEEKQLQIHLLKRLIDDNYPDQIAEEIFVRLITDQNVSDTVIQLLAQSRYKHNVVISKVTPAQK